MPNHRSIWINRGNTLADQLTRLRAAGFAVADCFWMLAEHAIYGRYR